MLLHFFNCEFVGSFAQFPGQFSGLILGTFLALYFYTGPDSILPIASGLAAVIGVLLMLWQRFLTFLSRFVQFCQQRLGRSFRRQ